MRDSSQQWMNRDFDGLRAGALPFYFQLTLVPVLQEDGYIFIRGVIPREVVLSARSVLASTLHAEWDAIDTTVGSIDDAYIKRGQKGLLLTGFRPVTHHPHVLRLLEGPELTNLFNRYLFRRRLQSTHSLFNEAPATFINKCVHCIHVGHSAACMAQVGARTRHRRAY